jgi:hypothetical protein
VSAYNHGNLYRLRFDAVAPADEDEAILWVDTSTTPPTLRTWDGADWTAVASEEGAHDHDAEYQPLDADLAALAALAPADDTFIQRKTGDWVARTPAQVKTDLAIVKADVGLANVDNTADAAKPVSSAQQTALDGKQPLDGDLTAIAALTPANGDYIFRSGGVWIKQTSEEARVHLAPAVGDLSDVFLDTPADGAVLTYSDSLGTWGAAPALTATESAKLDRIGATLTSYRVANLAVVASTPTTYASLALTEGLWLVEASVAVTQGANAGLIDCYLDAIGFPGSTNLAASAKGVWTSARIYLVVGAGGTTVNARTFSPVAHTVTALGGVAGFPSVSGIRAVCVG